MVTQWGMSDALGPRTYGQREDMIFLGREIHEERDYSETKAVKIDEEIDKLIGGALGTASELITKHKDAMDRIADYLMTHETIEREQFADIVGMPPANPKNVIKKDA
jgi:cell division protease FtsH